MKNNKVLNILYKIFIKYQLLFVLLIVIDQISKLIALKYLDDPITIFSWFKLELSINTGIAFSLFDDLPPWVSALVSIIATIAIEAYIIVKKPKDKIFTTILVFLAAGALGNGIDRWMAVFNLREGVVDFIYPTFFANFNVADMYVTCSCFVLIIYFLFTKEEKKEVVEKAKLPSEIAAEAKEKNDNGQSN